MTRIRRSPRDLRYMTAKRWPATTERSLYSINKLADFEERCVRAEKEIEGLRAERDVALEQKKQIEATKLALET